MAKKNITSDFSLSSSIWNTDKFLIESGSEEGDVQIKVSAQLVAKYITQIAQNSVMSGSFVLPFAGTVESADIKAQSVSEGVLGVEVWYVKSAGRFAAAVKNTSQVVSPVPTYLYDNWTLRSSYNDGFSVKSGRLFVRTGDDTPFWWNGAELRQFGLSNK